MAKKYVYFFGGGKADGRADMKEILGGKGANLAEMASLGIPVPAGFTISTEMCTEYYANKGKLPSSLIDEVNKAMQKVEKIMGKKFGDPKNPLLVSVRSGARISMPGMMETVLNVGLCSKTIPGLIEKTKNERFVYDSYRRLIMMYADVVMEKAAGIEPEKEELAVRKQMESAMEEMKKQKGVKLDTELTADDLKELSEKFKQIVKNTLKKEFPDDPNEQLWGAIKAVFQSWNGKRAIAYRRIEKIPDDWGTAVNVQSMVFGNLGDSSATGVAFTRNPATGENKFYGEWLINAQGEDVVAGIRTPYPLNEATKSQENQHLPSMEKLLPKTYKELVAIRNKLEKHFKDMQDIEFTIEEGKLYMLQTRTGKRTGMAAVRIAVDMVNEKLIDKKTAIMRVKPTQLDEFLHPMLDPADEQKAKVLAKGLPAGPGGAVGKIVLTADDAEAWTKKGEKVILVREETSPEDVHGMHAAEAILTARGGMTSHAALVARGWGKCCIVGCGSLHINLEKKEIYVAGEVLKEGDWISMNGSLGKVYKGALKVIPAQPEKNKWFASIMKWADEIRVLKVRTNAERPDDAEKAVEFGAEGIGLARTEHMFFQPERIIHMREMILAKNQEERRSAVMKLLPFQKEDFIGIFKAMNGRPVTVRLLDPPLHEFVGSLLEDPEELQNLAKVCSVTVDEIKARVEKLHEMNPMLGHRGCRLGITYPEITEMQARAILEAAGTLIKQKMKVLPEIMVPLVGTKQELDNQVAIIHQVAKDVMKEMGVKINYMVGTMIEVPRAALTANKIAETAEFFSFGTNDLTQMGFGFSRDDIGSFLPIYLEKKILPADPFEVLDQEGIGQLIQMAVEKGRATRPDLKCGICGEHGGEPSSVKFCHRVGLNYVSCSPYRVPIARFAAAQAEIESPRNKSSKPTKSAQKKKQKKTSRRK
ncbi:MAG TPA: pyruvate, phosphate dikinase [Candidatus Hydrogenedens sp.]|nr:pyruvate, phosphate dikinase [Candidatus Hydrogenedens sp.]HOL20338.1 pyruvate, phosphate dikinase [Candidatus Hydrogenedens sp.]HPP57832.1 pyruvate, phosphate dikinase [Candidatus Hydrogenedens sp.]